LKQVAIYYFDHQFEEDGLGEACSRCGREEGSIQKNEMRPLRRPWHKWMVNMALDLQPIVWEYGDLIHLAEDRVSVVGSCHMVINIQVP
jgi:hypothetical protein